MRDALRRGEVSSSELVRAALERAEATSELGSFVTLTAELALQEADAADTRIAETRSDDTVDALPPLIGVPTAHKDLVDVRGVATTHGSAALPHSVARVDDPVVAQLRAGGAISIGKTQVPEFGIAGYSENAIAPPSRNPHDPQRTSGGSSGGTAAAIAADVIPAAIASDAGGSIRIPSAACGLFGLKPGRGAVPTDRSRVAGGWSPIDEIGVPRMGVSGPVARTALDAALFYDVLRTPPGRPFNTHLPARRPHPEPSHNPHRVGPFSPCGDSETPEWPNSTGVARSGREMSAVEAVQQIDEDPQRLRGLRFGASLDSPFASWIDLHFDEPSRRALSLALTALEDAGHRVEEAELDYGDRYPTAFTTAWTAALTRIPFAPGAESRLGPLAAMYLDQARSTSPAQLEHAARALREFGERMRRQWGRYDIVITPGLAFAPPLVGEFDRRGPEGDYRLQCEWAPQTSMVNVVGVPAVLVPVIRASESPDGMPRGVQLIGRMGSEIQLLQLAAQLSALLHD